MSGVKWREAPLSQIATIEREAVSPDGILPSDIFIGLEHIDSEGNIDESNLAASSDIASTKFRFTERHLLYGKLRPYLKKIVRPNVRGVCSTDILPLLPNAEVADRSYLFHYLRQPSQIDLAVSRSAGANLPRLSPSILAEFLVRFPPLDEQRRIAGILDKADAIRRKRQQALALADDFLRSAFLEMFGDPVTNPRKLPQAPIKDFGRVVTGNTPSRQREDYYGDAIEWIKSDNLNNPSHWVTKAAEGLSSAGMAVARIVPADSTLVTCIAGSPSCIGNAGLTDRAVAVNQQINAVVPNSGTNPVFFYAQVLFGKKLVQLASTNSMKGMVSKGQFQEIMFINPIKAEQDRFGALFESFAKWYKQLADCVATSESLFASLSQRAFRGEL